MSRSVALFSLFGLLAFTWGCNPPAKESNDTTKKPKYEVDKGDSSTNSGAKDDSKKSDPPKSQPSANQGTNPGAGLEVVTPPDLSNRVKDTRSFQTLKPPSDLTPNGLMNFLAVSDQAFRELLLALQAQQVTESIVAERGSVIAKMKLDAAEKLLEIGETNDQKDAATCAKLESLSHLAGFKDVEAAKQLEEFAEQAAKISNPKAAHQAKLVMFGFRLNEYEAGQLGGSTRLLQEMDYLLGERSQLSLPDLRMMGQTLMALQRQGDQEGFALAKKKVVDAFKDHPDVRLMMECWQMAVMGTDSAMKLQQALTPIQNGSSGGSPELIQEACKLMIDNFPWMSTLVVIARNAIDVEFAGHPESSKIMLDQVGARMDLVTREDIKQDLNRTLQEFQTRYELAGKPLNLDGLCDAEGKALDVDRLKGKVTLVHFWASNSPPSLRVLGELKKVYQDYQSKGLEIVGICLDDDPVNSPAIKELGPLPWISVHSSDPNAKGFATPLARRCGVSAIPLQILIDAQGNVAALHLFDKRLRDKLDSLLSQP
jgi:thiol-disulfide isomerase/thioredoxin